MFTIPGFFFTKNGVENKFSLRMTIISLNYLFTCCSVKNYIRQKWLITSKKKKIFIDADVWGNIAIPKSG